MSSITRFTPPASCTGLQFGTLTGENGIAIRQGVNCRQPEGRLFWDSDCLPATTPPIAAGCPVGWSSETSFSTSVACCPSFYTFAQSPSYSCRLVLSESTTVPVTFCNTDNRANTLIPSASFASGTGFYARAIFLTSPAPISTIIVTATAVPSSGPSPNPSRSTATADNAGQTSAASIPTTPSDSGLSKGAIAGIVVGAMALLALLAAAALICIQRRKRRTSAQPIPGAPLMTNKYTDTRPELAATSPAIGVMTGAGYDVPHNKNHSPYITSSPSPPSELSGATSPYFQPIQPAWTSSSALQHTEVATHSHPNGAALPASHYAENTGPYYPEAYAAPDQANSSRLAELETAQRELEERMTRMRHLSAMEEEHARTQAEIARLKNN